MMKISLFLACLYFISIGFVENAENVSSRMEKMLKANPLIANMPMFQDITSENATSSTNSFFKSDKQTLKRSSEREIVSDNFGDEHYRRLNSSLFDSVKIEPNDIEFRFFRGMDQNQPTGRILADNDDDDDDDDLRAAISKEENDVKTSTSTTTQPFTASESLFETTISLAASTTSSPSFTNSFARSSPYFQSFSSASTPFSSTTSTTTTNFITEEDKFFIDENEIGSRVEESVDQQEEEEVPEEDEEDEPIDDISTVRTLENNGVTRGLPKASFRGTSYMPLKPLETGPMPKLPPKFFENHKRDENEVIQFNGKYSVSATKYYIDNRIDGEHFQNEIIEQRKAPKPGKRRSSAELEDNGLTVDPFAVEKEVRKVARLRAHAAKTANIDAIEIGDGSNMSNEFKKSGEYDYIDGEKPESQVKMEKKGGKDVETRETMYKGKKTTVSLWNKYLHGHDILRYPGAVFDDKFGRKRGKDHEFASKLLLSNSNFQDMSSQNSPQDSVFGGENVRRVVAGVANLAVKKLINPNSRSLQVTDDIQSICFNSQENTVVNNLSPFESVENVSKLECLTKCANSTKCFAATFSKSLALCAMYNGNIGENQKIRSQGHSYHKKIDRTTLKCIKMFSSKDFLRNFDSSDDWERSPTFLRLVEKDGLSSSDEKNREENAMLSPAVLPPLFPSTPRCPEGEDVIFVRSDLVERSEDRRNNNSIEISEDDCVFACLTNTRPGGGKPLDCVAIEYDKRRGLCYLMQNFPGDVAMTPRPVNPVTLYEKICVKQSSANQCSGGQPSRFRQKVLIGHLVDAYSVKTAAECINMCISKKEIGCVSALFYSKENSLNCILNDTTHLEDPASFYEETSTIVDYFSIEDCLGIPEVEREKRKRIEKIRRKMMKRLKKRVVKKMS